MASTLNKKERRAAIYAVLNTWDDDQVARALEWVENDMPILVGCEEAATRYLQELPDGSIAL